MSDTIILWSGKPSYKRILIRKETWRMLHPINIKTKLKIALKERQWFCNIQLCLIGFLKYNGEIQIRLLNRVLVIGW